MRSIRKSTEMLQPIYEAFTNAWEAIYERFGSDNFQHGKITISFYLNKSMFEGQDAVYKLMHITVQDNGAGINMDSFARLVNLRDSSKGKNNKGTGRIQYIHFFDKTTFDSTYIKDESYEHIKLTMSKNDAFLYNNAILREDVKDDGQKENVGTVVRFEVLLSDNKKEKKDPLKVFYNNPQIHAIKKDIIVHFLSRLCESRERLPQIEIRRFEGDELKDSTTIQAIDVPTPEFEKPLSVHLSKLENNKVVDAVAFENFQLLAFSRSKDELKKNQIHLVSNGALAQSVNVDGLQPTDVIEKKRFMFLLRSPYFDSVDDDVRGNLALVKEAEFKKQNEQNLYPEECILIDHVLDATNAKIAELYPCFGEKKEEAVRNLEELKEMFLLDETAISTLKKKVKSADTDEAILKSLYEADSDLMAARDAELKKLYDELTHLNPDDKEYQEKLDGHVKQFTKIVPLQNRTGLTKYIARRKLVLKVFEMVLNRELKKLENGERIDEEILHNLIFHKHSDNPDRSDLWLFDDQFLYFKGTSEYKLDKICIDGTKLIKEKLTKEEEEYKIRNTYDDKKKDRGILRPDIFLYPEEGKCVIIEFKAPDVDVSEYLDQITLYASLINNLSDDKFKIHTFYGYLVGENVDYEAISDKNPYFIEAANLKYIFRPDYPIKGKFNKSQGNLYTEIIKYSDIFERAKNRNRIFLEKLDALE